MLMSAGMAEVESVLRIWQAYFATRVIPTWKRSRLTHSCVELRIAYYAAATVQNGSGTLYLKD